MMFCMSKWLLIQIKTERLFFQNDIFITTQDSLLHTCIWVTVKCGILGKQILRFDICTFFLRVGIVTYRDRCVEFDDPGHVISTYFIQHCVDVADNIALLKYAAIQSHIQSHNDPIASMEWSKYILFQSWYNITGARCGTP